MRTSGSIQFTTQLGEVGIGVCNNDRAKRNGRYKLDGKFDDSKVNNGKFKNNEIRKKNQKTSKSKNLTKSKKLCKSKKMVRSLDFLTPRARLAFTKLRQVFVKAPILHHFDSKRHIWVEMDKLGYSISGIFSQLTLDDWSQ